MIRIYVFVEGQTEESFVKNVLHDYFFFKNIELKAILFRTGQSGRGGVVTYGKIKRQIERLCKSDRSAFVTTMMDVYGLPKDFPGKKAAWKELDIIKKAQMLEDAFYRDIDHYKFIPNLTLHEFEALLFSQPEIFSKYLDQNAAIKLATEAKKFKTPEHINDNPKTAPSKRIKHHYPGYQKVVAGIQIAKAIGLENIRMQCKHFDQWIGKIEKLRQAGTPSRFTV